MATTSTLSKTAAAPFRLALREPLRVLGAGLLLGAAFDLLFWGQRLGLSVFLFVLLLAGALGVTGRFEQRPVRPVTLWLLLPLFGSAFFIGVRSNGWLTFLNVATLLFLLTLLAFYYAAGDWRGVPATILALIPGWVVLQSAIDGALLVAAVEWRAPDRRRWLPLVRGLALALPVLLLFGGLLAAADLVFASWLSLLLGWLRVEKVVEWSLRALLILFIGTGLAGGLAYAMRRGQTPEKTDGPLLRLNVALGFVEATTIMAAVDALFGLFVVVQFAYLFGGAGNIAPEQFSYAEYARRGFAEIVIVSVLSLGLLLVLHQLARRETKRQLHGFNGLGTLQVGLLLIMLVSAAQRLALYESAFGLTHRRLYSHLFMLWLGLLLLWLVVVLWRRPEQFFGGLLACALGFVLTVNLVNPDALIARVNVARVNDAAENAAAEVGESAAETAGRLSVDPYTPSTGVDVYFLAGLSDDAVPAMVASLDRLSPAAREVMAAELMARRERYEGNDDEWPAFHIGRWRAERALKLWQPPSVRSGETVH